MSLEEAGNGSLDSGLVKPKIDDKVKETKEPVEDSSADGDVVDDEKSEGAEEEEALFVAMEKDNEKDEAEHLQDQPNDLKSAPKLLQSALEQGQVKSDDSDSEGEKKVVEKPSSPETHHPHARVRTN
jgi:hypothetical protein